MPGAGEDARHHIGIEIEAYRQLFTRMPMKKALTSSPGLRDAIRPFEMCAKR